MSLKMQVIEDTASQLLANLSLNLRYKAHDRILSIGLEMMNYSLTICPVRTGYLRSSIFFLVKATLEFEFGASATYAIFVEMGTWKMAAQPFIRPAIEIYTSAILNAVVEGVMEACRG